MNTWDLGNNEEHQRLRDLLGSYTLGHLGEADETTLRRLIESHARATGSRRAQQILEDWSAQRARFVKVFPKEYRRALGELAAANRKAAA